ncbi:unnamed protein product [Staurois parvus]|uniref:Uncharacterized protein n=1 Tax=Staurois parvus TaxID=386267 RepID=A0ABN9GR02_9NEOB|nr:unnamed protein product [Staurois parvus]
MDGRVVSVVRRAKSATCGQQGIKGAGREWSRSQAGFSNSRTAQYRGSGRRMVRNEPVVRTGDGQQESGSGRVGNKVSSHRN